MKFSVKEIVYSAFSLTFCNYIMFNFFYWLQVEINPNLIVAEISYDNNVVVCDLNYTGYYARIYNCKHEGLL